MRAQVHDRSQRVQRVDLAEAQRRRGRGAHERLRLDSAQQQRAQRTTRAHDHDAAFNKVGN